MLLRDKDIGGGEVGRTFTNGDRQMKRGEKLTREEILKMPRPNREALVSKGMLLVYPSGGAAAKASGPVDRFMVSRGPGQFDVVEGRKVNKEVLTKVEAMALAGVDEKSKEPKPAKKPKKKKAKKPATKKMN